jgi:cytochrome P450
VFGADADVFRPERWIEAGGDERAEMRRVAELAFGYGRWGCAGKMIALLELNKVFVEVSFLSLLFFLFFSQSGADDE